MLDPGSGARKGHNKINSECTQRSIACSAVDQPQAPDNFSCLVLEAQIVFPTSKSTLYAGTQRAHQRRTRATGSVRHHHSAAHVWQYPTLPCQNFAVSFGLQRHWLRLSSQARLGTERQPEVSLEATKDMDGKWCFVR